MTQDNKAINEDRSIDEYIEKYNQEFGLIMVGTKTYVLQEDVSNSLGRKHFVLRDVTAFKQMYINDQFPVFDKDDKAKLIPAAEYWLKSPKRRSFTNIVFLPGEQAGDMKDGRFNIWQDYIIMPKEGDCSLFWGLVREVWCGGDEELYQWTRKWMAHAIQKPEVLPFVALILRGGEGIGKGSGVEFFGKLFGSHYGRYSDHEMLFGKHTGHLKDKIIVFADECIWGGNRKDAGPIKDLITAPFRIVDDKFVSPYEIANYTRLIVASNEDWAIPVGMDARRFVFYNVPDLLRDDTEFFNALYKQMETGGLEALIYDLAIEDISAFVPWETPIGNKAQGMDIKELTMNPVQKYVFEWLCSDKSAVGKVLAGNMYNEYLLFAKAIGETRFETPRGFTAKVWGKLLPKTEAHKTSIDGGKGQVRTLPTQLTMRNWFEQKVLHHPIDWDEPGRVNVRTTSVIDNMIEIR